MTVYDWTQTAQELINDAFQLAGIYGIEGSTVSTADNNFALNLLNKMVKSWSTQGLHLWEKEEALLFLQPSVASYSLGDAGTDAYCAVLSDTIISQLTNSQALGSTSITLDSVTGMAISDYIGIVLDGLLIQWTTITNIVGNVVTINNALTGAASAVNIVYTFTNRLYKPLRITSCRRIEGIDSGVTSTISEVWMTAMSYSEYFNMSSKTINGTPSGYMYTPKINNGLLYIWQRPSDPSIRIQFSYERIIKDLDTAGDSFDFPAEWLEPLTYQLAVRLGPAYGKDERSMNALLPLASQMLENLKDWDTEITSVKFKPNISPRNY